MSGEVARMGVWLHLSGRDIYVHVPVCVGKLIHIFLSSLH